MRDDFRGFRADIRAGGGGDSHIWTGAFILLIGVAALLRITLPGFPVWVFTWQTLLVALGLFIGVKHKFRGFTWLILTLTGAVFLIKKIHPDLSLNKYIWPVALIVAGAFIILRPGRKCGPSAGGWKRSTDNDDFIGAKINAGISGEGTWSQDDYIDTTAIFGGAKKIMLSKNFKGGEIVNIFGGTELNLTQADIQGRVELDITTIFGGTELIVPSHWQVKSEAVTIFGGLEDKRSLQPDSQFSEKTLVLKGTVLFGGIEIKSF